MKESFLVTLIILVCTVVMATSVAAQSVPGIPQQLLEIQGTLNWLKSEITAIKNQLNVGVTVKLRRYYVTKDTFDGSTALQACAAGFHMANLYEILDPSNLQYDTILGFTQDDSGLGPPSHASGWIRTGFINNVGTTPQQDNGRANCNSWTSNDETHNGTWMYLKNHWNDQPTQPADERVAPWIVALSEQCNSLDRVWCVEDP